MLPKNLWKLTIDPRGKTNTLANSFVFCKNKSIIGIGWILSKTPIDKNDATFLFRKKYQKGIAGFNVIVHRMSVGDHVWVYGGKKYYVCKIVSDWGYSSGHMWDDNDIHHIRKAKWKEISIELVPGCIKRSLTMFGTANRIGANNYMLQYSDWLFNNSISLSNIYSNIQVSKIIAKLKTNSHGWVFEVLDADETEDLIGLYIQKILDWCMIKSSTYKNQRDFECEYRRVQNGVDETAFMQVKSGNTITLDCKDYMKYIGGVNTYIYLFSTAKTPYLNVSASKNIIAIDQKDIIKFAITNTALLPLPALLKLFVA